MAKMRRRFLVLSMVTAVLGTALLFSSFWTERAIPPVATFGSFDRTVFAYIARDELDADGHEVETVIMPDAFAFESTACSINATIGVDAPAYRTLLGVPIAAEVRCGARTGKFVPGQPEAPVAAVTREQIIDRVYVECPALQSVPRSAFTSGTFSTPILAGWATLALRVAGSLLLVIAAVVGATLFVWVQRRDVRKIMRRCPTCGYPRQGLESPVCPECGKS
jgi:hypothetical protein